MARYFHCTPNPHTRTYIKTPGPDLLGSWQGSSLLLVQELVRAPLHARAHSHTPPCRHCPQYPAQELCGGGIVKGHGSAYVQAAVHLSCG